MKPVPKAPSESKQELVIWLFHNKGYFNSVPCDEFGNIVAHLECGAQNRQAANNIVLLGE